MLKQGYMQVVEHIRDEYKFYLSIVVGTILALGWANTNFMTSAQAQVTHEKIVEEMIQADKRLSEGIQQLTDQQEKMNLLLATMIAKEALSNVKVAIKNNEAEMFQLQQFMRVNGPDPQSEKRLNQLKVERKDIEITRTCIINENPICD